MKIKKLHIENFRCFQSLDLSFENFTTLVGENGTGKTAVLEAINLALSPSYIASRINEQDFNHSDSGDILIRVAFDESFIAKLPDGYVTQDVPCDHVELKVKRREKATPGKALSEGFTISHYVIPNQSVTKTEEGWRKPRKKGAPYKFSTRHLSFPVELVSPTRCFYFDRHREKQSKIGFNSTLQKISQEYNWRFRKSLQQNKDSFLEKWDEFYDLVIGNVDEKKLKDTFEPVKKKLLSLIGKEYEGLEFSILNLEQPFSKSFFSMRDGLNQVEQSGLGSGISMVLTYFLLETISSLAKEHLIILIDEPELHLHPQLQNKLRQHLKKSKAQIVLSTHSESMIDIGDWNSIKRFDKSHNCFPTPQRLNTNLDYKGSTQTIKDHLEELKQYYQDKTIFFKENNEILFARSCLLVEGPVDKYGIMVLSQLVGDLDLSDLTIVACNGKDKIPYYQLMCRAFEIPFFTLFDLDGKGEKSEENQVIIKWSANNSWHAFNDSIEHLFGTQNDKHKASATMQAIDNCNILPDELRVAFEKIKTFIG